MRRVAPFSRGEGLGRLAAGDVGDDDVGGVAVEVLASPVVDGRGAGVGVAGCDLDVTQRDAGVERGHDERRRAACGDGRPESGVFADRDDPSVRGASIETLSVGASQDGAVVRSPMARSMVRAVRGTSGMRAGLLPLPTMRRVRCPRSKARSSMLVAHASLTRSPFSPSSTANAAWSRSNRSAVNKNVPSSVRSSPRPSLGWTRGRRTYWAGFDAMRPSMCANR